MAKLTPNDVAILCYGVGWGPKSNGTDQATVTKWLDVAAAVVNGESGFDPAATNGAMKGLWQINTTVHADKIGSDNVYDLHTNTMLARDISNSDPKGQWHPWQAYNDKSPRYLAGKGHGKEMYSYLKSMTHAERLIRYQDLTKLDTQSLSGPLGPGTEETLNSLTPAGMLSDALTFVKEGSAAIGVFILGAILFIVGLWFLAKQSNAGRAVTDATTGLVKKAVVL